MKIFLSILILFCLTGNQTKFKVNGTYLVQSHYVSLDGPIPIQDYNITFYDSTYIKRLEGGDFILGKIRRYKELPTVFLLDSIRNGEIIDHNNVSYKYALKWPVMEFKEEDNDTIEFKMTHLNNLHRIYGVGILVKK